MTPTTKPTDATALVLLDNELTYARTKHPSEHTPGLTLEALQDKFHRFAAANGSTADEDRLEQMGKALLAIACIAIKSITDQGLPIAARIVLDEPPPALPDPAAEPGTIDQANLADPCHTCGTPPASAPADPDKN